MATSSFFYGGSSAPDQNTVDELIDALNAATAAAEQDKTSAEAAAQQAAASATNANVSEQNAALIVQQSQSLLSQTTAQANAAAGSATNAASSATNAASSATAASASASAASSSASSAAVSAAAAANDAAETDAIVNAYVISVASDLAGTGWNYDFGLITDAPDSVGSGTAPGYIETVATNIDDVQTVATNMTSVVGAISAATNAAASASAASASQSAAATSASNASSSATAAAASASTASTQATNAANSATAAAGSASAASTSATNAASSASAASSSATAASGSATSASGSATAAASSASAASTSATAAQTARTAAEAALDSFDDRYLGAKTSAPTVDNDGNALITGALYFNSTLGQMFAWSGTAWGAIGSNPDSVLGPASSTDNAIARFDGTTGKLVQNSGVTVKDTGGVTIANTVEVGNVIEATTTGYGSAVFAVSYNGNLYSNSVTTGNLTWNGSNGADSSFVYTPTLALRGAGGSYITDTLLTRDAAGIVAQRNGTNPQTFRVYNTFTDASNYERGFLKWDTNRLDIGMEGAGTGSGERQVRLTTSGGFSYVEVGQYVSRTRVQGTDTTEWVAGQMKMMRDGIITWSFATAFGNGVDTGLARDSAGVVKVTNGSTGLGVLKASSLDIDTFDLGVLP